MKIALIVLAVGILAATLLTNRWLIELDKRVTRLQNADNETDPDERCCPEHPDQPWNHTPCSLDDDPYGYVHTPPVPPYGSEATS